MTFAPTHHTFPTARSILEDAIREARLENEPKLDAIMKRIKPHYRYDWTKREWK